MVCKKCGARIGRNKFFCDKCGTSIGNVGEMERYNAVWKKQRKKAIIIGCVFVAVIASCVTFVLKSGILNTNAPVSSQNVPVEDMNFVKAENTPIPTEQPAVEAMVIATSEPTAVPTLLPTIPPTLLPTKSPKDDTYLYPSDKIIFTDRFLQSLDKDTARLVRNELYARHGFVFKTKYLQKYFSQKSWYHGDLSVTESDIMKQFSAVEAQNHEIIVNYEKSMGWIETNNEESGDEMPQ
ncbi:MAG: YARHG domain-containing protein [Clostridia bacterium]|nr:YARHG domain-containing protein [Clostridia bacterium]